MAALKLACALMLCMLLASPMANAAITCGQVIGMVEPCLNYLKSGGAVPAPCCTGIRNLQGAAKTTPDRQTACRCLQSAAKGMGSAINPGLAAGLPAKCDVNIPYKISASTNCNSVK